MKPEVTASESTKLPRQQTICGKRAVQAALEHRLDQVQRLFFAPELAAELQPVLKKLAKNRAIFRELPPAELDKVAGGRAHQGLCAVLVWPEVSALTREHVEQTAKQPGVTVLLDGVGNPHNLGAIARTAAFLGAQALWLPREGADIIRSSAAYRTAEGGLEQLPVLAGADPLAIVRAFVQAGGQAVALSVRGQKTLENLAELHDKPVLLVLGSEENGLDPQVEAACPVQVRIPGTQRVESLNVGVAAGIALAAMGARG